jgi:methyltransferase
VTTLVILFAIAFGPMLAEAARSTANERRLRALGSVEPAGDVYRVMQIAYPACFIAMIAEAWMRGVGLPSLSIAGLVVFAAAKALKYWAIATLGERWTFRVLVPAGSARIVRGPYAYVRHPNYVAVAGELAGFALLTRASITGAIATIGFVLLMLARIRIEERALGLRTR